MTRCEDAPCCGCCGTNLYGVNQEADSEPEYCDLCGYNHRGDCFEDDYDDDEDTMTVNEMLEGLGSGFRKEEHGPFD